MRHAFHEIVSGRRQGLLAGVARCGLWFASKIYATATYIRNRRYDHGGLPVHRAEVPVISVGNLTTGGTGKTPMVAWIARWFRERGVRVTLISRGYGAEAGSRNDEALELELQLPDVPHLQNPDRIAAARIAVDELAAELIVLDDGFQHRRIHRDLDLVLIDALLPLGYGYLLPRGLLRESLSGLSRAGAIGLSRADLVSESERAALRSTIARVAPRAAWFEVAHRPRRLLSVHEPAQEISALRGQRVAAFCGIGNPAGFRRTLQQCGAEIAAFREFPDHFAYGAHDVAALAAWCDTLDVELIVCTMKDFVKLRVDRLARHPLRALQIEVELLSGHRALESELSAILSRVRSR